MGDSPSDRPTDDGSNDDNEANGDKSQALGGPPKRNAFLLDVVHWDGWHILLGQTSPAWGMDRFAGMNGRVGRGRERTIRHRLLIQQVDIVPFLSR